MWSKTRQILESRLAENLKGRVSFHYDVYRTKGCKIKDTKLEMVDAMLANNKLTDEEIAIISGIPLDEIQKRRAQR
jgi:hypothetical protein